MMPEQVVMIYWERHFLQNLSLKISILIYSLKNQYIINYLFTNNFKVIYSQSTTSCSFESIPILT